MVEVAVLEEVAEIFASLRDVDAALARFLELAREVAGAGVNGAMYLRDDARAMFLRWREHPGTPALHLPVALVDSFFAGVDHRVVSLDDPMLDGVEAATRSRTGGVHAALGLPMRHGGRLVGVLGLGFGSVDDLPASKVRTLAALARFPAAALEHARTQAIGDRRARHADLLRRFGERALGALGALDAPALHRLILDTTVELTGSNQASITEVHGERVRVVAGVGKDEALVGSEGPAESMQEALTAEGPYVVEDVAVADKGKLLVRMAEKFGAGTFMALAMRHETRVFGYLFAGAAAAHAYHAETVEAMRILASMAAAVLEQRSAQADAQRQAGRLAATIEHLPMFIEVYDRTGALVRGNGIARLARVRFGALHPTAQRACGEMTVTQLDGTRIDPAELPPALALQGLHPPRREVILLRDGNKLMTALMAAEPIFAPDGGTVEAVVLACQDISALHELAQEKDRFLSVAAHELRTPLTALHATTQLIEVDPSAFEDRARREVVLGRIRRQTARLVRLVGQLLDSVKAQSGEVPLRPVETDLVALCRDVLEMSIPSGGKVRVVADGPVVGKWDPVRLEQVVTNLLSNAVRFSPEGREVVVGVRRGDGGKAFLSVTDEGIGIPAAQREMLFTPFFRGTNAQKNVPGAASMAGGLGLGLHIAREIVRRHGGAITVDSREGGGTVFTVELPMEASP